MVILQILGEKGEPLARDGRPITITLAHVPDRDRLELGAELSVRKSERSHIVRLNRPGALLVQDIADVADYVTDWYGFQDENKEPLPCTRRAVVALFALRPLVMKQVQAALRRMLADGVYTY